jgi:arylsulfatase A-like enzyme
VNASTRWTPLSNRLRAAGASPWAEVLLIAVWFGLVTGLVEAMAYLLLKGRGGPLDVTVELLWVAPLVDLAGFVLIGLVLAVTVGRRWPPPRSLTLAVGVLAFLALADWVALLSVDRLYPWAVAALAAGLAAELARQFRKRDALFRSFFRRSLPVVVMLALVLLVAIQGGKWLHERAAVALLPEAPPGSPSVLLIVVDTLRADHLGSHGYGRPTSPAIDELARQGTLFENAISTSSWSLPAHASLFTGRITREHSVDWSQPLYFYETPFPTLAEELRARGYRTAAFSANLEWVSRSLGFGRGFLHFEDYFQSLEDILLRPFYGRLVEQQVLQRLGYDDLPGRRGAADIRQAALRWVGQGSERPFFIFLNLMDTHDPYLPPEPYRSTFASTSQPGGVLNRRVGRGDPVLAEDELQAEIDAYDGAIAYVDDQIGQLLADLDARGLGDNLLVVITSDHGEAFGEHRTFIHGNSLFREEIQVPLIFRQRGFVPAGTRVSPPVSFAAIPATILELVGATANPFVRFPSLSALWAPEGPPTSWPPPLAEMAQIPWVPEAAPSRHGAIKALLSQRWHFMMHQTFGPALFDWFDDPQEQVNLVSSPDLAQMLTQLQNTLVQAIMENPIAPAPPTPAPQGQ